MADVVKEERETHYSPENVPEREGHGHAAQHEVGDGETHDEVVPRRPHYGLAQDGVLHCQLISQWSNQIWDSVTDKKQLIFPLKNTTKNIFV